MVQPHIQLDETLGVKYAILPGDPARVDRIAEQLDQVQPENLQAVADLVDYKGSTGAYMPEVKIYVDGFTDVGAIGENNISIEIRKA